MESACRHSACCILQVACALRLFMLAASLSGVLYSNQCISPSGTHLLILVFHTAVEEAIIALVRLHQKYTFMLSDKLMTQPLELKQGITISPKGGLPVTVVSRASKQSGVAAGA